MEEASEPIHKSSMEPHSASPESSTARTAYSGNSRGAPLAECSVVSSNSTNGSLSTMAIVSASDSDNIPQDTASPTTEQLDALRVEIIRSQLVHRNLNPQATTDLMAQRVSYTDFTPSDLVNFLADMRSQHNLQAPTLKTLRAAVTHLHDNSTSISEAPKETRGKRRIIKPFMIRPHAIDPELCLALPIDLWLLPGRDLGVSMDKIVALVNLAPSDTFVNHYQRNQMAQIDFTSVVLSAPSSDEMFFDANDEFSLY
ncbi:hypothetical protein [Parasitella parasitica]|uniref:Uncharacterized protein n=1 Tax=Parasitella parasitica TaxID=35722 RepID=A0A0B7N1H3_9FUNG|nr:hypothetical protein [Parasitella parasitica]